MSKPAVIQATYHTFRHVQSRKALQIVFEVPEETSGEVLAILGTPTHDASKWFAIAKLDPRVATTTEQPPAGPAKAKPDYTRSQIAHLKVNDPTFCAWLMGRYQTQGSMGYDTPDAFLKAHLKIASKSELDSDRDAASRWDSLLTEFDHRSHIR